MRIKDIHFGCHQLPERCYYFRGKIMPFCSRCLGCSIGHVVSFVLFLFGHHPPYVFATIFIIPLAIDWSIQRYLDIASNNSRRLVTGILGGYSVGIIIWNMINDLFEWII